MMTNRLSCRELVELVTEYLEDTLAPAERRRFDEHIGACHPCAAYLGQLRATHRLLGTLSEHDVPIPAQGPLLRAFGAWRRAELSTTDA